MNDEYPTIPGAGASSRAVANGLAMLAELRSGEAFGNQLIQLVEAQMNGHLQAGSVDEWHHPVLDDLVSRAVAVEVLRIEAEGGARLAELKARLAAAELSIDELGQRAQDAAAMVGPAQARVAQAEARLLAAASDTSEAAAEGQGGPARLAHVNAQISELRSAMASTLQRTGAPSPSALPEAIAIGKARDASLGRGIDEQATRVARARRALERMESVPPEGSSPHHKGGPGPEADFRAGHHAGSSDEDTGMGDVAA